MIGWKTANHRLPFLLDFLQTPMGAFPTNALPLLLCDSSESRRARRSLSLLDANRRLWGFFQQLKHKKQGSIFFNPTKRTQEIQTVKRTPFTDRFPANQLFARTIFSFLSFYVNICYFVTFWIVLRFFLLADVAILLPYKVGKIPIICPEVTFSFHFTTNRFGSAVMELERFLFYFIFRCFF